MFGRATIRLGIGPHSSFFEFLAPCSKLSWLPVSVWAHVNYHVDGTEVRPRRIIWNCDNSVGPLGSISTVNTRIGKMKSKYPIQSLCFSRATSVVKLHMWRHFVNFSVTY